MKRPPFVVLSALVIALAALLSPQLARADRIEFKNGTTLDGVIKRVEEGKVLVQVAEEVREFSVLDIKMMDFDTPHLNVGASKLPLEHFLANMEAQEMVVHIESVEKAAVEVRRIIDQTRAQWANRNASASLDKSAWEANKERLRRALSGYHEVLGDFYLHVAGKVDQYQSLTRQAREVSAEAKVISHIKSPLVDKEQERLPLKKFVPSNWYDTIYYAGYEAGYTQGFYGARPVDMNSPQ